MRAILLILIIAVVALIAAVQIGLVDFRQTRAGTAPTVRAADGKIVTQPGRAPAFDVETGSIGVGTRDTRVPVPSIEVKRGETSVRLPNVEVREPAPVPATDNIANAAR